MNRVAFAQRAKQEGLIGDAQPPFGADERRHHPGMTERAARGAIEMTDDFGAEIAPFKRRKAPDETVRRLSRARHRSEERRVGKAFVITCRSRRSPYN